MKEQITYNDFDKIDIRVGTVISVKKNEKARKPSLVIEVDFGKEIGIKQSSAQITHYYNEENLIGKQVIGICNFPEKNIRLSFDYLSLNKRIEFENESTENFENWLLAIWDEIRVLSFNKSCTDQECIYCKKINYA